MTGVLVVNMGGPSSESDMEVFLKRMFIDPNILPVPNLLRKFLAKKISKSRYKESWSKYKLIGGTPIIGNTQATATDLEKALGENFCCQMAFSYSNPLISEGLQKLVNKGVEKIIVLPLYPQGSYTTTKSVVEDVEKCKAITKEIPVRVACEFYTNENFLAFWQEIIKNHIETNNLENPLLIFSAHSIPVSVVEKGDSYPTAIAETAKILSQRLNMKYEVTFQSKIGKVEWVGPDTKEFLTEYRKTKDAKLVFVPISFVSENLETLYDQGKDIIPYCQSLNFEHVSRVEIPKTHPKMTKALVDLVNLEISKK